MKKLITLTTLIALTGCATSGQMKSNYISPAQNYRLKDGTELTITGNAGRRYIDNIGTHRAEINIQINGDPVISNAPLDREYFGQAHGVWQNHKVSTDCSSKSVSAEWLETHCLVFIDNEKTVTLTF